MTNPNLLEINDDNFDKEALQSPLPVLVDFTAAWCAPCRAIAPHVASIADAYAGRLRVRKCDVDSNQASAIRFEIRSMPTLMVFNQGKVVGQLVGAVPRFKIDALLAKVLPSLPASAMAADGHVTT